MTVKTLSRIEIRLVFCSSPLHTSPLPSHFLPFPPPLTFRSGMSATSSQAFRARLSSETILIPTRHDPKSSQRIVLWKDVQRCFEHAKYIMYRREMVPFLTDDDFEE